MSSVNIILAVGLCAKLSVPQFIIDEIGINNNTYYLLILIIILRVK